LGWRGPAIDLLKSNSPYKILWSVLGQDERPTMNDRFLPSPTYSIVLPAYNESQRIAATLEKIFAYADQRGWQLEVLVVNDGSTDDTARIVREYGSKHPTLRLLENPGNRGKGYSVRNGMLQAQGDILLFSDADLSSPIAEGDKLFAAIRQGADLAIGSRWVNAELQIKRQPLYRQLLGRLFNLALRLVLGLNFKDTQCGFKAFTRDAAQKIFPLQKIERWGFDPELLYLARRSGLTVAEVPVAWSHREGTRINPLLDGARMLGEIFVIRWNALSGKYPACPTVSQPS
jgi:glycosyltransferase involved in cell wall biosynthesis